MEEVVEFLHRDYHENDSLLEASAVERYFVVVILTLFCLKVFQLLIFIDLNKSSVTVSSSISGNMLIFPLSVTVPNLMSAVSVMSVFL